MVDGLSEYIVNFRLFVKGIAVTVGLSLLTILNAFRSVSLLSIGGTHLSVPLILSLGLIETISVYGPCCFVVPSRSSALKLLDAKYQVSARP